ncbi:MAG TPA: hypothetical protein VI299_03730 [Polyangiales bacterium]
MSNQSGEKNRRTFAELIAIRGVALACMFGALALGLYVTHRGEQLRAFKRARANGSLVDPPHCPTIEQQVEARLESDELDEVSGMVASRDQPGLFWVHNDSGDEARIFAVGRDGALRAEVTLEGVDARDFEDISLFAREGAPDLLYVADTGNNLKQRKTVQLHLLEEPNVPRDNALRKLSRKVQTVEITYEDGTHDVEAMFVDARGDVYMITKAHLLARDELDGVYRVTAAQMKQRRAVAHRVASVPAGPATAAAVSPDGRAVAVRNYWVALWWPIKEGETPADAFQAPPCHLWLRESTRQGEALTFQLDGSGFLTLSEGEHSHFLRYTYGPPKQ